MGKRAQCSIGMQDAEMPMSSAAMMQNQVGGHGVEGGASHVGCRMGMRRRRGFFERFGEARGIA